MRHVGFVIVDRFDKPLYLAADNDRRRLKTLSEERRRVVAGILPGALAEFIP